MARDRASRPGAKPLRLFLAIEIPEAAKAAVDEGFAPWHQRFPEARWVPAENWHVTLKFLGGTWPRLVDWVHERVRVAAEASAFETRISGIGAFPSPRRARVLWAGLDDPQGRMAALAWALDGLLAREFRAEKRAFSPHLTVARSDPPLRLPEEYAAATLEGEPFRVERVALFLSHLQRPAPRYELVAAFPFAC